jgi:glycosyltransferase involved in cell wall biosynthesis
MYIRFMFFTIFCLFSLEKLEAKKTQSICLNMIVKDESAIICRCLTSVKPIIDYWVIVDTGSTDGTQRIIQDFMKDIPGELHERPWVNFAHNRNEALELAKNKGDYILFIDADEILSFSKEFKLPELDKDFYYITTQFSGTTYERVQLIKSSLDWKWKGVLHEAIDASQAKSHANLAGVTNIVRTDGNRSNDTQKFQKDAKLLESALLEEPDNTRYVFYLAQSYKDAQIYDLALNNYKKRISMGGWDQEIFWSMFQIGIIQELLKEKPENIISSYYNAYLYRSSRAEPLYRIANFHRQTKNYLAGYHAARQGLNLPKCSDILFVENWVYDYGLMLEFSICAYWTEKYTEALLASYLLLANPALPSNVRECVQNNLVWINSKINQPKEFLINSISLLDLVKPEELY